MNITLKKFVRRSNKGYSLIEIMLGMAIVSAILVAAIQLARTINDRMKVESTKSILRAAKAGADQYKIDLGHYPAKIEELVTPPSDANDRRRWQGPYGVSAEQAKDGVLRDSYGNEIQYKYDSTKQTVELFSWGKGGEGSDVGNIFVD